MLGVAQEVPGQGKEKHVGSRELHSYPECGSQERGQSACSLRRPTVGQTENCVIETKERREEKEIERVADAVHGRQPVKDRGAVDIPARQTETGSEQARRGNPGPGDGRRQPEGGLK